MSAYNNTPGTCVPSLAPGQLGFSLGSQQTQGFPITKTVAASASGAVRTSNVVTVTTTAAHGFQAGQYVTVAVTTIASGGVSFDGTFLIASVPSTTTFTYAQTAANGTGGAGTVYCPSNVQTQALLASGSSGQQFAIAALTPPQGRTVTWSHAYNLPADAVTLKLQGAMQDLESAYVDLDSDTTVGGNTKVVTAVQERFLRIKCTALTVGTGAGQTATIGV